VKAGRLSLTLGLSGAALAAALVLPAIAQESLLPEGFGGPSETPAPRPAPTPGTSPSQGPSSGPAPTPGRVAPQPVTVTAPTAASAPSAEGADASETAEPGTLKYDLPPGARRLLTRIGPLTPETGGLGPDAFGVRGQYAAAIMRRTGGALDRAVGRL
jgi:hypothetical protein